MSKPEVPGNKACVLVCGIQACHWSRQQVGAVLSPAVLSTWTITLSSSSCASPRVRDLFQNDNSEVPLVGTMHLEAFHTETCCSPEEKRHESALHESALLSQFLCGSVFWAGMEKGLGPTTPAGNCWEAVRGDLRCEACEGGCEGSSAFSSLPPHGCMSPKALCEQCQ